MTPTSPDLGGLQWTGKARQPRPETVPDTWCGFCKQALRSICVSGELAKIAGPEDGTRPDEASGLLWARGYDARASGQRQPGLGASKRYLL
jgi:hypothetical protein